MTLMFFQIYILQQLEVQIGSAERAFSKPGRLKINFNNTITEFAKCKTSKIVNFVAY